MAFGVIIRYIEIKLTRGSFSPNLGSVDPGPHILEPLDMDCPHSALHISTSDLLFLQY
jgi:hypothetical protein